MGDVTDIERTGELYASSKNKMAVPILWVLMF